MLSSDDVTLDGSTHAAHFNSAFQSDFRLVNIALTGQLTAIPLPSPASGFTYEFDSATGTFVRSTRSFGPILSDRAETIGKGRLAFGFSNQFFSFDHLDGVSLSAVPAVFRHDSFELGGGRADVVSTDKHRRRPTVGQFAGALTFGLTSRIDVSLAVPSSGRSLSLLSNARIQRLGTGTNLRVHYFQDPTALGGFGSTASILHRGVGERCRDLVAASEGDDDPRRQSRACGGTRYQAANRRRTKSAWHGRHGVRPFAAVSGAWGALAPHANIAYQWNGESVLAGTSAPGRKPTCPTSFSMRSAAMSR